MNEQRLQSYLRFIAELLYCASGQEAKILHQHAELIDRELVAIMFHYAESLDLQGNIDSARKLLFVAENLSFGLGMTNDSLEHRLDDPKQFYMYVLQIILKNEGDTEQIYQFLAQHQEKLNEQLLQILPKLAETFRLLEPEQRLDIARVLVVFADFIQRFPLGQRWVNFELSIAAYQLALQVFTRDSSPENWAAIQNNLANVYRERIRGDKAENQEQAITFYQLSLQVCSRDDFPHEWAMAQNNLANVYCERIREDKAENLEQAITACQLALQIYTREAFPQEWAMAQSSLANVYNNRIRMNRSENLEQAITACQLALQIYTREAFPQEWARNQNNLANIYYNRIGGHRVENLEQAIEASQLALQVFSRDDFPQEWAVVYMGLGNAYVERIRGDKSENLEQAITAYQYALQVLTYKNFPQNWATTQNNLAIAYMEMVRGDKSENLEQAIAACQLALRVFTCDAFPQDWAMAHTTMGNAYNQRIRGDRAENLEQAIAAFQLALQVYTYEEFPQRWASLQNNFANVYRERIRGDRAENLEQAIAGLSLALQVYTYEEFPQEWARVHSNLGLSYNERICGDKAENLEQAIAAFQLALKIRTREAFPIYWAATQNNLAISYNDRILGNRTENIEQAIIGYQLSLQIFTYETFPREYGLGNRNLGNLYFEQQDWVEAANTYTLALKAVETLYKSAILLDGKVAELTKSLGLSGLTAYTLARSGKLKAAALIIEQGRARGLSESLDRDRTNLETLQQQAPVLYTQYKDITQQLRNLEAQQRDRMVSRDRHSITPETLRNEAIRLRQQLTETINQIHHQPGYETFLRLPTFADVQQVANSARPLIYLLTTPAGSLALIVQPNTTESVWLDNFTETQLTELLRSWFAAYNQSQRDRQEWFDAINQITRQLWEPLMAPLIDHLKKYSFQQAILIPTGFLSLLPLHAAWTENPSQPTGKRHALDDIHFTYAPNAKSLTAAQAIATHTQSDSILAIDDPRNDLSNSAREIEAAIKSFHKPAVLRHSEATINNVRSQLTKASIVHFSCHGTANLDDPLNSGLLMSDGLLTLRDILALNLSEHGGIRLAILSACETGLSGVENADEAISLPTGLLQAGVAGVIASLWAVSDLSTRLLLVKFYELWREEKLPPDQALRQAQLWLRDSTDGEKEDFFPDFMALDRSDRSFTHPYHWGAFSYTGV